MYSNLPNQYITLTYRANILLWLTELIFYSDLPSQQFSVTAWPSQHSSVTYPANNLHQPTQPIFYSNLPSLYHKVTYQANIHQALPTSFCSPSRFKERLCPRLVLFELHTQNDFYCCIILFLITCYYSPSITLYQWSRHKLLFVCPRCLINCVHAISIQGYVLLNVSTVFISAMDSLNECIYIYLYIIDIIILMASEKCLKLV